MLELTSPSSLLARNAVLEYFAKVERACRYQLFDLRMPEKFEVRQYGTTLLFLRTFLEQDKAGDVPPGALVKLYFGGPTAVWGLPPTALSLDAYLALMDGTSFCWAVAVLGGDVIGSGLARAALEKGGHLRVGLEDYAGTQSPTNVELVRRAVALCEDAGSPVATPTEAAELLGLARR